ncbi:putative quinol monooxygenase [Rhizobium sp. NPDC090275]|uniref:putative quinol monooxygenase n=1 Tax=Rhizobium sp. NPDC090275 TaxID=3364498 RepID=UPI000DE1445F
MIEVIAAFRAKPGSEDKLREATLAIVEPTRREEGCIQFVVHEDTDAPGTFFIRESWRDQAALTAHFEQPYLKALVELHKDILAEPLKLHNLKVHA